MSEEPHAVVRLLLKRMESHPEEFKRIKMFGSRWSEYVNDIEELGSEADKAAIGKAMQNIRMNEIHEAVMDELVNGPERRREEEETQQQAARASQLYAQGATAGQALATSKDGHTWTKLDHDAYLAQSQHAELAPSGSAERPYAKPTGLRWGHRHARHHRIRPRPENRNRIRSVNGCH